VHVGVPGVTGDLGLEHREHVRADDLVATSLVPRDLVAGGVEAQGDVVGVEYADQRPTTRPLARTPAVEPEHPVAAVVPGTHGVDDGVSHAGPPASCG
jgi:hypothetical protein